MCVSQFISYGNAADIKYFNSDKEFFEFKNKKNIEVHIPPRQSGSLHRGEGLFVREEKNCTIRFCFFWNLQKLKKLAEKNNIYAIEHLKSK